MLAQLHVLLVRGGPRISFAVVSLRLSLFGGGPHFSWSCGGPHFKLFCGGPHFILICGGPQCDLACGGPHNAIAVLI